MKLKSVELKKKMLSFVMLSAVAMPAGTTFASRAADNFSGSVSADSALLTYRQSQWRYETTLARAEHSTKENIERLMEGLYFVDFGHAAPELFEIFTGNKKIQEIQFPFLYDHPNEPAFKSYLEARNFLSQMKTPLNFSLIQHMHKLAVPWENSSGRGPGTVRQRFVYGPEFEQGLYPDQIQAINQNPYLFYMQGTGIYADVPQGQDQARIGERVRGAIVYPRPRDLKPEILHRLKASHPVLVEKILKYQADFGHEFSNQSEALTQELVAALLEERIETFEREQARLGNLESSEAIDRYISLMARFQKDYVSIHPFPDGNGRTSRLLLYYLAERKGLPAPRIVYPNEDLFWSVEMWEKHVRDGMIATLQLKKELATRLQKNLPIEKSVALLTPVLPIADLKPYEEYVRNRFQNETSLKADLQRDPVGTMRKMKSEYKPKALACSGIHRAG